LEAGLDPKEPRTPVQTSRSTHQAQLKKPHGAPPIHHGSFIKTVKVHHDITTTQWCYWHSLWQSWFIRIIIGAMMVVPTDIGLLSFLFQTTCQP